MYYYLDILQRRERFGIVWLAAFNCAEFKKRKIVALVRSYDIDKCCDDILRFAAEGRENCPRMNLYVTSTLLTGLCKLFRKKCELILDDAARVFVRWGEVARLLSLLDAKDVKRFRRFGYIRGTEEKLTRLINAPEQPLKRKRKRRENEYDVPALSHEELAELLRQADSFRVSDPSEITMKEMQSQPGTELVEQQGLQFGGIESMLPELQGILSGVEPSTVPAVPPHEEPSTAVITEVTPVEIPLEALEAPLPPVEELRAALPKEQEPPELLGQVLEELLVKDVEEPQETTVDQSSMLATEQPSALAPEEPIELAIVQLPLVAPEQPSILPSEEHQRVGVEQLPAVEIAAEQPPQEAPMLELQLPPPPERRGAGRFKLKKDGVVTVCRKPIDQTQLFNLIALKDRRWKKRGYKRDEKETPLSNILESLPVPNDPAPAFLSFHNELWPRMQFQDPEEEEIRSLMRGDHSRHSISMRHSFGPFTPEVESRIKPGVSPLSPSKQVAEVIEGLSTIPEMIVPEEAGVPMEPRPIEDISSILEEELSAKKRKEDELPAKRRKEGEELPLKKSKESSITRPKTTDVPEALETISEMTIPPEAGEPLEERPLEVVSTILGEEPPAKRIRVHEESSPLKSKDSSISSVRLEANLLLMAVTAAAEHDAVTFAMLAPPRSTSKLNAARLFTSLINLEAKQMLKTQQNEPFSDIFITVIQETPLE